jgi:hypothetical protein
MKSGDNMQREFVIMPVFEEQWKSMGLDDNDLKVLQEQLLNNPQQGNIIQGTGGLRKLRISFGNKGKSGGARILYVDFVVKEVIYFIFAYPKSKKDNLTKEERNNIKKVIEQIRGLL